MLRDFVPPIAVTLARKVFSASAASRPAAQQTYVTYEAALADCGGQGYEDSDLVEVVRHKTQAYRARGAQLVTPTNAHSLCALWASIQAPDIHVLDFGGACGAHYFLARAVLPRSYRLHWTVVETPAMASAAAVFATEELTFCSSLPVGQSFDLLHASGSLQCVRRPRECLAELLALRARYIFFSRLALTTAADDVIVVHESMLSAHGPGPMAPGP